ncbi:hypothetical protein SERLADRAFT_400383 [Serpula lacrymans var. lacrymans S7.9]|uniref:Uncharacterized protein n=1 Tax=Serpula lacrymans var. lacrymans (strain S7.9) TaxID=578457 RepID=F8P9A0_SERL9|nr:uncharacterized protein SERLADRAFT_400383 [Serpula lacrymans var. lacrymans S7.9]EGO20229.1 hypothetical protein SERLADRAFT_400383 [Serpula lacrymans var. lacrymans S7.9]
MTVSEPRTHSCTPPAPPTLPVSSDTMMARRLGHSIDILLNYIGHWELGAGAVL